MLILSDANPKSLFLSLMNTGARYSLCHGTDNQECHLDCWSGWSAWYDLRIVDLG